MVLCPSACKCYRQCFCFEWVCGCPFDSYHNTEVSFGKIAPRQAGDLKETRPCMGFCCEVTNLYFGFPACLSIYEQFNCLCCQTEGLFCKPMCCQSKAKSSLCCKLSKGNLFCITPTTCCKSICQCFCIDNRCAMPCDQEVPCICMIFPYVTLISNYAIHFDVCATMGELTGENIVK